MKMTMGRIRLAFQSLAWLSQQQLNMDAVVRIRLLKNSLRPHAEIIEEQITAIGRELGKDGIIAPGSPAMAEADRRLAELLAVEVDVPNVRPLCREDDLWFRHLGLPPDQQRQALQVPEAILEGLGEFLDWQIPEGA
jgi:hypothetical protein